MNRYFTNIKFKRNSLEPRLAGIGELSVNHLWGKRLMPKTSRDFDE